jgi:twitching motility protein PilI
MSDTVDKAPARAAPGRTDLAAKRTRLRLYQEQLLERMQAARTNSGARVSQLGVEIGGNGYLIDLTETGEIVPVPQLASVPLTRPWYLGLANVRGNLLGVVDLARYLGQDEADDGRTRAPAAPNLARLITFSPNLAFPCALLAGRVYGLRQAGDMQQEDDHLRDADGNTWTPLSLAGLVAEERFLQVGL